jgi:hypothetical protein
MAGMLNVDSITTSTPQGVLGAGNASLMKNRIINGAMVIDQRNSGASVTNDTTFNQFSADRWIIGGSVASKFTAQVVNTTPPSGFINYVRITSLSAYTVGASEYFNIQQRIEGFNISDLDFGLATAKPLALSKMVRSSLTGTFGGVIYNASGTQSYPFTYSIPVANTWTPLVITITGCTSGTWLTTNGIGMQVIFNLGAGATVSGTAGTWAGTIYRSATGATSVVGTSGATFDITGVQLEVGSVATGYEYEIYSQTESKCFRYFRILEAIVGTGWTAANAGPNVLPSNMRATPTIGTVTFNTSTGATFAAVDSKLVYQTAAHGGNQCLAYVPLSAEL